MRKVNRLVTATGIVLAASALAQADDAARSVGTVIDDAAITTSVKSQLIGSPETKAYQINVETREGVVQLNGFVDSAAAKTAASRLASQAKGVVRIDNNLEVRAADRTAGEVVGDAALTARVDAALAADKRTSALRIDVASKQGTVQLSGFAESAAERTAAAEVARSVEGVAALRNEIAVR